MPIAVDLPGGRADQDDGVEIGGFQGQRAVFVLQQHGSIFAGLLDDPGVGLDGLRGDVVLCRAVQIAEVDNLIEHVAGGAGDRPLR